MEPGSRLGPYEIVAPLGAGGMGEVWRARDTRLDRDVAIKVLPEEFFEDKERRERFRREAKLLAAVSHPNIATVFSFEEVSGRHLLVQELVQGETLAARLAGGALAVDDVLRLGRQLAEALVYAHGQGVIHRDFKSANVIVTPEGRAKVLDFGLARRLAAADLTEASTATAGGAVTGTLAYMAPEQLLGRPADARSDLWAFGVVLYEMATGTRPFQERLSTALIDEIIHGEPRPPGRIRPGLPPGLERIILKCLEKEPVNRYASVGDLLDDLTRLEQREAIGSAAGIPSSRRSMMTGLFLGFAIVAILVIAVGGYLVWRNRSSPSGPRSGRVMLAVLPVDNLSGDPAQEYFSDGLTEELIAQLGGLKPARLGVIARTSAMRYKKTDKPVDQIGRELGVDYLLESSVRREGGRVRITAQLVQVRDQTHLWAESYERDLAGVLRIQSEVAEKVARSLAVELLPAERARLASSRPVNPEAHELCLKGRHHWNLRTAKDLLKATEFFRAAIAVDPSYAPAWAGLGDSYALYAHYGVLAPREAFPQARAAAEKALALDPTLVEAETTLAFVTFYYDWDWARAETQLRGILGRHPDYAVARHWYAEYLSAMGRHDEALREIRRARESDPLSPVLRVIEGYVLFFARRYEQALESLQKALPLDPDFALVHAWLGRTYLALGRYEDALSEFRWDRELRDSGASYEAHAALVYAASGKRDEARKLLAGMSGPGRTGQPLSPVWMVALHAALGDNDEAMVWLEKAYAERSVNLVQAKVNPRFDPLRSDQRFQSLLRRMNFPPG